MNADELLERLLAHGVAREVPARSGIRRAVSVNRIELAIATDRRERSMRARWRERVGMTGLNYLLVADDPDRRGSVDVLGPITYDVPIRSVECDRLFDVFEAIPEMVALDAVRHVAAEVDRLARRGMVVEGLLPRHSLEDRFRNDAARWRAAERAVESLRISTDWRSVIRGLGYEIERLPLRGYIARYEGRPVATVHPRARAEDFFRLDEIGRPAEGVLAGDCVTNGTRYGILACQSRFRLIDCDSSATTAECLDLDAPLLGTERLPYLALLGPSYLAEGGLASLQEEARAFGAKLRNRLDETLRHDALPAIAEGLQHWAQRNGVDVQEDSQRTELEHASLTLIFRLLFVLYAESSRFLPIENETYRCRSLSALIDETHRTERRLSEKSTALWSTFNTLVRALRAGNPAWGVPAYNGALFAAEDFAGAELLERLEFADPFFGRVLLAIGLEPTTERGVDYSSLAISHLGHIYESLLSLRLSVTDRRLRYDKYADRYVPATTETPDDIAAGSLLWLTNEGGRKSGGVYYTPVALVRHLIDRAVLPAYEAHLDNVRAVARTDPRRAAKELLSFKVLDPACGSAHFLVQVVESLADRAIAFLAATPLPAIRDSLDGLRAQAQGGAAVTDVALLRRLILKHCVFGVDLSPMGAEVATLSLWLASFVPGLSLAYLGRNVVVGNSLIGVGAVRSVVREGAIPSEAMHSALAEASDAMARLAEIDDRTPSEVEASRAADDHAQHVTAGAQRLCDLWIAEGFGVTGARTLAETDGLAVLAGTNGDIDAELVTRASKLAAQHRFLHWPLAFPRAFAGGNGGFDVVVGNPPWEEVKVEKLGFYVLHRPGLQGIAQRERDELIAELERERPELSEALADEMERAAAWREAVKTGEYEPTVGDPDLYKFFCQRYRLLVKEGGSLGVVLPRTAFVNAGSEGFRGWLFSNTTARRIDFLINHGKWMFDTHAQYGVALVVADNRGPAENHSVEIAAAADSAESWNRQSSSAGIKVKPSSFLPGWITPRLRSQAEADVLQKLRVGSRFPVGASARWSCFPVRELDESNDKHLWRNSVEGWKLWKGGSFGQFDPHGAETRICPVNGKVLNKVRKKRPGSKSLVADFLSLADRRQAVLAELDRARVAYRAASRSDDRRTIYACLVPPKVFLANSAPYLVFPNGDEQVQAACLGVMNCLPFDWQARRYVEANVNVFILEALTVPSLDDEAYTEVAQAAARLSAVDKRFADFAAANGVEYGRLDDAERARLRVEIDAWVSHAWQLTESDLEVMFDDFTTDAVSPAYRTALLERLAELR